MSAHLFLRPHTIRVFTTLTDVIVEASPARTIILVELRWYFEQARAHPAPSRCPDLDERFYRARDAFSAPRFKGLYAVWKQDGEAAFAACSSDDLDNAVTAGAGRVETLELGHRYGHLSPLVAVA